MLSLAMAIFLSGLVQAAEPNADDVAKILKWLPQSVLNDGVSITDIAHITLSKKEPALLATASFENRGRNFSQSSILVRPQLEQAREVEGVSTLLYVNEDQNGVYDMNEDGVSEVVLESVSSGQGGMAAYRSLVYFDGWKQIILHDVYYYDYAGSCAGVNGKSMECFINDVTWNFDYLFGEKRSMIEMLRFLNEDKWMIKVNVFALKNNKMVLVSPTLSKVISMPK